MHALRVLLHVLFLAAVLQLAPIARAESPQTELAADSAATLGAGNFLQVLGRKTTGSQDGVKLIFRPDSAMQVRVALIRKAEVSIDLQYFIWGDDQSGLSLLKELREAAARGVKIRILLDDFHSSAIDPHLAQLSVNANIEVKFFNVLAGPRGSTFLKFVASLPDLARVRHRMHNKLFIADNAVALMGGRNIGDEYLTAGSNSFFDMELLTMGPMVRVMSDSFEEYWTSAHSASVRTSGDPRALAAAQDISKSTPAIPLVDPLALGINTGSLDLQMCPAQVIADPVVKVTGRYLSDSTGTLHASIVRLIVDAKQEIAVVSPYFVRGLAGLMRANALSQRGVRQRVWTNSLSSTDSILAYIAYRRHRHQLLASGIEIREFAPIEADHLALAAAGTLHAKLAVVDRRFVYVGSLNFTSRSERLNTEIGVVLDCPALAADVMSVVDQIPGYDVRLGRGETPIVWKDARPGMHGHWDFEPGATLWQHLQALILNPWIPDSEI